MQCSRLTFVSLSTCAVALALSGCSSTMISGRPQATAAPAVTSVGEQVNGVAANRWQYVQFNEAMDPSTINSGTIVVTDASGRAATGNVAYYAGLDVAGFKASPALQENASYTLTVTTGAASEQGVHLPAAYTDTFATRASSDESPIYVKNVTPAPDAQCVNAITPITITFSEGADVSSLTATNIAITGPGNTLIQAKIGYEVATATVTLTPSGPLPSGSITVDVNNVADAAGVKMTSPFMWSFLTTCSGGGGGGNATTQYMEPLVAGSASSTLHGQITVDTKGNTAIQVTGAPHGMTYTVQFCPAFDESSSYKPLDCFNITSISTDASGNANATIKFPQPGNWSGDFSLNDSSGKAAAQTYLPVNATNLTYMSTLLPETTTNHGVVTTASPQNPLTSGMVSYSNGSVKAVVKGAAPNTLFAVVESENTYIDSSGSYEVDTFTTDAMGNGTATTSLMNNGSGGDMFDVVPQMATGAGYIGGFSVPQ